MEGGYVTIPGVQTSPGWSTFIEVHDGVYVNSLQAVLGPVPCDLTVDRVHIKSGFLTLTAPLKEPVVLKRGVRLVFDPGAICLNMSAWSCIGERYE